MASELLINAGALETRIAFVEDGVLQGYGVAGFHNAARLGDIYLGRVTRMMAAMQAGFVDIGQDRDGFLSLRDAPRALQEGAAVVVTVTREAIGEKGARLSAKVTLTPELEACRKNSSPPALLKAGPDAIEQALAQWKADVILTDDARTARRLNIACVSDDLFTRHDLEDQIAALAARRVWLASGGWITLEATEGLTAIDVNSGAFAASGGREETARRVNLEAAAEIGRQLRLRGLGGLIVVDFIQMASGGEAVTAALRQSLAGDARETEILPMNAFGMVAVARQRRAAPLFASDPCRSCGGSGERPLVQAAAMDILRAVERSARAAPGREIVVRAPLAVSAWLAAHGEAVRAGLDRRGVGLVRYIGEAREDFDVAS